MITRIKITGFKSFQDFEMEFTPLTVIAGANASGKSNLFDALQLLSRLAEVDLRTAFGEQRGDASELFTQYHGTSDTSMSFEVDMLLNRSVKDNWGGVADLRYTRLRYSITIERRTNERGIEELFVSNERLVNIKQDDDQWASKTIDPIYRDFWCPRVQSSENSSLFIDSEDVKGIRCFIIPQDQPQGNKRSFPASEARQSVLSSISNVDFSHIFAAREEMRSWKFLQLNPEDLRQPSVQGPNSSDTISQSGKNLAAALFRIRQEDEYIMVEISRKMHGFVSEFSQVQVHDDRANKQYVIKLMGYDGRIFPSSVLSEGTLRLLAMCVLLYDPQHNSTLCFEEPENGIHPENIKALVELLKELSADFSETDFPARQAIVTTHSPAIVSEVIQLANNSTASLWFAHTSALVGRGRQTRVTGVISVPNYRQTELLPMIEKMGIRQAVKHLTSTDYSLAAEKVKEGTK